jgi:PAS domain S-box-containing protein
MLKSGPIEKKGWGSGKLESGSEGVPKLSGRFGKLLDAAPDAMAFVDVNAKIVLANVQMEKLFGYSQQELIGSDLHMLIPERFHNRHRDNVSRYFAEPGARPMGSGLKIYGLKKDGTEFSADISLSPLKSKDRIFVIAAIRDISERVRAEEQIELDFQIQRAISALLKIALEPISLEMQLEHSLDLIFSISNLALQSVASIYVLDDTTDTLVLRAQRGLSDIQLQFCSELPLERKAGDGPSMICDLVFTKCVSAPGEIIEKKDYRKVNCCIPIFSGEKVVGLINVFAKEGHEVGPNEKAFLNAVANTLAVVIQRYQIENEKQELREQLNQSERLAALGRISANVAHEIRNPLTVVGGFARRLQHIIQDEDSQREYIDFIVSEVSNLEEILKDILNYARTTTLQLNRHRIYEIVDDVLKAYEDLCKERSITIMNSYNYTSDITIDRNRVREVIVNIVSNALDAIGNNGTLTVGTGQEQVDGISYVTVKISDTGEGISLDKLDKIFEPFFTTKVSTRGIGLGLSISKRIMEEHGGFIKVASTIGAGTTFTLYFPHDRKV